MKIVRPELTVIDRRAIIGSSVIIWPFSTIGEKTTIESDCVVGSNVYIGKNCYICARTRIQHGVFIPNRTVIKNDVFIGPMVVMTDDKNPVCGNKDYDAKPPVIEQHASIGAGALILPGVVIGEFSRIGAGAIVTHDVEPYAVVRGEPSRMRRKGEMVGL